MTRIFSRLAAWLDVRADESQFVLLLLVHSFFIGITRTFADAAANSLFLVQFSAQDFPYLYIGSSITLTIMGFIYSFLERRVSLRPFLIGNLGFIFAFLCVSRVLLAQTNARWPAFALVIGFEALWVLTSLEFWGLAGRIFTVRQGKRLFGLIGTGGVVATVIGGLTVPLIVPVLGTPNLLLLAAGGIAVALAFMLRIFRLMDTEATVPLIPAEDNRQSQPRSYRDLLKNRYVVLIFALAAFAMIGRYFVDNAFYDQAQLQYGGGDQLAGFLGVFLAISGFLTLVSRVFVSRLLLGHYGVIAGLLVLPVMLLLGAGAVIVTGSVFGAAVPAIFWLVAMTRLIDKVLRFSIHRASVQVLYQPLPVGQRLWVQTTSESIVEAIAGGIAGIALLVLHSALTFGAVQINLGLVIILVGWIAIVVLLNRQYVIVLMKALTSRRFGRTSLTLEDGSSIAVLNKGLESPYAAEVIYSLNMLEQIEHKNLGDALIDLLRHPAPEVRQDVLARIERHGIKSATARIYELVNSESVPSIRGMALRTWAMLGGTEIYLQLMPYLEDAEPEVIVGAMIGLLQNGGVEGGTTAGQRLVRLLNSATPAERELAARVLGETGFRDLHGLVARLLRDSDPGVRRAALVAAGKLKHSVLWPLVIEGLVSPEVYPAAISALLNADESIFPQLEQAFIVRNGRHQPREVLIRVARVCGRIPDARITLLLQSQIAFPDSRVRDHILAALRLRKYRAHVKDTLTVQEQIVREVEQAAWLLAALNDIGGETIVFEDAALLCGALTYELGQIRQRIFLLLSFVYDTETVLRARDNLNHASRDTRSYALEILDVLLPQELKAILFPLLDEGSAIQRLERLADQFPQPHLGRDERLKAILNGVQIERWTKVCALYWVAGLANPEFTDSIKSTLALSDPLIHEMALWTLNKITSGVYRLSTSSLGEGSSLEWPDTITHMASQIEQGIHGGKMLLLTVEKVIILKTVSIFSETPDALLAEIAALLKEVEVGTGERIIEKGDIGNHLYIIVDGEVRIHDGERTITHLGEREVVGELALLDSEPRNASVTAVEDTLLLRLDQDAFYELINDYPDVVRGIIRVLTRRLRASNAR
jgi:ATP:ADP antiporter, AAA family